MTPLEQKELDRKAASEVVAIEEAKVETPAQVVSGKSNVPALVEHNDSVMNITAKQEHKQNMLGSETRNPRTRGRTSRRKNT